MAGEKKASASQGNSGGIMAKAEGYVRTVASVVPFKQCSSWVAAYFHPEDTIRAEMKNANFGNIAMNAFLIGIVTSVSFAIALLLLFGFALLTSANISAALAANLAMYAILLVAVPFIYVISAFVSSLIYFIIAKLLGGKGGYMEQTLGMVLVTGGVMLAVMPFQILSSIPFIGLIGLIFLLLALPFSLYGIYSQYRMIKAVHSLSSGRAAAVIIIPIVVMIVLVVILIAIAGVALLSFVPGSAVATASTAHY
ncbi:MAG: YIP1 family protein [Candidatus Micrarchaeota archaeon]|nr:YIP1 family protein [Candidatus Micrarchaeota archaeon]